MAARHDIVVVGASAGGLSALQRLLAALPAGFPGSIFIVLHIPERPKSRLAEMLRKHCALAVLEATDRAPIEVGKVYVAPSNRHLMLTRGRMRLSAGPRENLHRPAADPLFRSAAWAYGPRVVGIVLSGSNDDGAVGLAAIKACRGTALVQDPLEAEYPDMPRNALREGPVDCCAGVQRLAERVVALAAEPVADPEDFEVSERIRIETEFALMERGPEDMDALGEPSDFSCPTCGGVLTEVRAGKEAHYRCHTGHAFSQQSLFDAQGVVVEDALYAAVRALDEISRMARRMSRTFVHLPTEQRAGYEKKARDMEDSALVLRKFIVERKTVAPVAVPAV
jgi:two-component system chemotaxis response regulator CheB